GWDLEGTGVDLLVVPSLVDVAGPRISVRPVAGLPLLHVEEPELGGGARLVKHLVERVAAAVLLVLLLPLLVAVGLAVRCTSRGPALFAQQRVGKHGRRFTLYKFRTMRRSAEAELVDLADANEHDGPLFKIRDDPRRTRLGRALRRVSIDEVPQLWNVVVGQMSIVGPRPPLPCEVEGYSDEARRRLLVKPGLTGLWQVSGRADLPWAEAVRLDLYYVENWSPALDLVILAKTLTAVVRGRGAY
ncbi:MAG: exopolysaccharide biosynthesis polyprenyl glycosylphosphotransferase, partial [Acidimicrobiales bacterium]